MPARLFWQNKVSMFDCSNPGGTIATSREYRLILVSLMLVSAMVSAKRLWLGIFLGRKTFGRYYSRPEALVESL